MAETPDDVATEALTDPPPPADVVMAAQRATARLVGVLFIVATVTSIIGGSLLLPPDDPDYLIEVAAHQGRVILGSSWSSSSPCRSSGSPLFCSLRSGCAAAARGCSDRPAGDEPGGPP